MAVRLTKHKNYCAFLQVESLLATIVSEFRANLPTVNWMDEATRDKAVEKIDALSHKIGYPEYLKDPVKLDHKYYNVCTSTPHGHSLNGNYNIIFWPLLWSLASMSPYNSLEWTLRLTF